jgi:hypothetical protein
MVGLLLLGVYCLELRPPRNSVKTSSRDRLLAMGPERLRAFLKAYNIPTRGLRQPNALASAVLDALVRFVRLVFKAQIA